MENVNLETLENLNIVRKVDSRIDISYGSEGVTDILDYDSNDLNPISNEKSLYNNNHTPKVSAFTLEANSEQEEGLKNTLEAARGLVNADVVGWWSNNSFSGLNKGSSGGYAFKVAPALTVNFGKDRPIQTLQIYGDTKLKEYPIKFKIKLYTKTNIKDSVAIEVYNKEFINNDTYSKIESEKIERIVNLLPDEFTGNEKYTVKDGYIVDIRIMVVEILEWNLPNRMSKIYRCYDDILEQYHQDEVQSFECVHENPNSGEIKFGLVSGSCSVTLLNNKNRKFDLGYLKKLTHLNKRVMPFVKTIKESKEYEKMGTYFIKEWDISQDDMFVHCKANDRLLDFQDMKFSGLMPQTPNETLTFKELFEYVLNSANKALNKNFKYNIEPQLGIKTEINKIEPYLPRESVWSVLQMLCEASLSFVYVDKNDVICVKSELRSCDIKSINCDKDDSNCVIETDSGISVLPSNAFGISIPFFADMTANRVEIPYFKKTVKADSELYKITGISANAGDLLEYTVEFDDFCEIEKVEFNLENVNKFNKIKITDFKYKISFNVLNAIENVDLKVIGKKITFEKQSLSSEEGESIKESGLSLYTHPDCKLVQNKLLAEAIAKKILSVYVAGTKTASTNWRGNEKLNLIDKFEISDRFGGKAEYRATYIKNTIDGGFKQEVKGMLIKVLKEGVYKNDDGAG